MRTSIPIFALEIIVLLAMYLLISWFAGADAILFAAPVFFVGWFFGWLEAKQPSRWSGLRNEAPAREPAKERTEHDPGLRCKGNIGGQTDDNAQRQAQHGSERDGGSHAHMGECMTAPR